MSGIVATSIVLGLGVVAIIYALFPAPETLAARLARLEAPRDLRRVVAPRGESASATAHDRSTSPYRKVRARAAKALYIEVSARTNLVGHFTADLEVTRSDPASFLFDAVAAGLVAAALVPIAWIAFLAVGARLPWVLSPIALAAAAFCGASLAPLELKAKARRARGEFAWVLAAYLGLVSTALAGGMAIEEALTAAATVGNSWALTAIRGALGQGVIYGATPWEALAGLGRRYGISDLTSLVRSVRLAGSEGARVRASIAQRSRSISGRLTTEAKEKAAATGERLFLASVVCMAGFLLLILYPAVAGLGKL